MILGSDVVFHFNRFYETSQQIKEGNFQYFLSIYGFQQSARIVNALYGPFLPISRSAGLESFVVFLPTARQLGCSLLAGFSMFGLLKKLSQWLAVSGDEHPVYGDLFCPVLIERQAFCLGAAVLPLCGFH